MTDNMRIEEAGPLSAGYPEKIRGAVVHQHPRIKDILSGIILLAARTKEPIPLAKIHSSIQSMKSHESILSGLRFSLTGAVCHSRDIDQAITSLTDGGFLNIVEGSAFVGSTFPSSGTILHDLRS